MTASLLIDESPIILLPSLAQAIGVNEAIVLQQIHYWLRNFERVETRKPIAERTHYRAGRWWVWNTMADWQADNFPFWSLRTVERTVASLYEKGLLISEAFNPEKYNHTRWYSIDYAMLEKSNDAYRQNGGIDPANMAVSPRQFGGMESANMAVSVNREYTETNPETTQSSPALTGRNRVASWGGSHSPDYYEPESNDDTQRVALDDDGNEIPNHKGHNYPKWATPESIQEEQFLSIVGRKWYAHSGQKKIVRGIIAASMAGATMTPKSTYQETIFLIRNLDTLTQAPAILPPDWYDKKAEWAIHNRGKINLGAFISSILNRDLLMEFCDEKLKGIQHGRHTQGA
jgi:hypothetical protein